mmetsp:Transcript_11140/g.16363  ORF Transcript_11140/g.16363 Transcript_11140/m.16363 type:complete len:359 (+) Transcript_11140:17-1093(+)
MDTPQDYIEQACWDRKDIEILQSLVFDPKPVVSCDLLKQNNTTWCSSPPNVINKREHRVYLQQEVASTVKNHTKTVKWAAIKKQRSPYNLFFQIERELIIAELSHSPPARSLGRNRLSLIDSQGSSLALEDALHDVPLPARYQGAGILNPLKVINNQRRKHRKVHGKIGFLQLSRTIAEKWKNADQKTKDYFKALSMKDLERYRHESERNSASCTSMSTDDDSALLGTNGIHIELNKPVNILTHAERRKRKATQVIDHPEVHLKRQCLISEPYQVKSSITHDVHVDPFTELTRLRSLTTSHWRNPLPSNMFCEPVHVASHESVCIGNNTPDNLRDSNSNQVPCFSNGSVHYNLSNTRV